MTKDEFRQIEDRWKFGTNTREDVRKLLDEVVRLNICGENEWYREVVSDYLQKLGEIQ